MNNETKQRPEQNIRLGRLVASVWENADNEGKTFKSVTFQRSYRDKDNNPKSSSSFTGSDLPGLIMLTQSVCHELGIVTSYAPVEITQPVEVAQ